MAAITTREFVLDDYGGAIALWNDVEGVEICEGDSREEIAEYLKRNPGLSRVAQAFRREKVGQRLLDDCVRGLREAGLKRAIILVAGDNPAGQQFWLRHGW